MEAEDGDIEDAGLRRARSSSVGSGSGSGGSGSASGAEESEERAAGASWTRAELFDRIMQECRHNSQGQCFSAKVREEIERLSPGGRARLVSGERRGAPPLFVSCERGNLPCAEYLVHVCGASLEQRGLYRAPADPVPHRVTPLWAAAVAGRLEVLRALADAGAELDARSDSGSTPLRSACFMSHAHVARFLLGRGADPSAANHSGGTCLMNSVQSVPLVRLLLAAGAPVDAQDAKRKTALHYAVLEQREEVARLLLAAGADPMLRSAAGDDALQLACIKGASRLVVGLVTGLPALGAARVADSYELLGATVLDEYNDSTVAAHWWRVATALRHREPERPVPKRPVVAPAVALRGLREWTTQLQLDAHAHDADWLRSQALLVVLRVLGPEHNDTLYRLMYRGAAYADAGRFTRCVSLWMWALELRIQRDTLLHSETCQTLLALTRLLLDAGNSTSYYALLLLKRLAQALPECQRLLVVRPQCRVQGAMFDRTLRCLLHLIHVAHSETEPDAPLALELRAQVTALVSMELHATATGDSLLHWACSRLTVVRSTYFADDMPEPEAVFPSGSVARLLVSCGADVAQRNRARCTPLHLAAIPYNFTTELVETLLSCGAHLDQPNRYGDSPAELVQLNPKSRVCPLQHVTLACRAARAVLRAVPRGAAPRLAARLPATLRPFLHLHLP